MNKKEIKVFRTYHFTAVNNTLRKNFKKNTIERIHVLFTMLLHIYYQVKVRQDKAQELFNDIPDEYMVQDYEYLNTDDKVFLSSTKIKTLLGHDYVYILKELNNLGLLEFEYDDVGKIKKARNIILNSKIINSNKLNVEYSQGHVFNSLLTYYSGWEKELRDNADCYHHNWKNTLLLNNKEFGEILEYRYYRKKYKCSVSQYKKGQEYLYGVFRNFHNTKTKSERLVFYRTDDFSGRYHSIFSRISKEYRHYIKLWDRRCNKYTNDLMELDIKTSQPTFLSQCCVEKIGDSDFAKLLNANVDLYELWKNIDSHESRDAAKDDMFINMFQCSYYSSDIKKITKRMEKFQKEFPIEANYIYQMQCRYRYDSVERKRCVARAMQKLEVNAFRDIWDELISLNIPFASIHDSIIFPSKDKVKVLKLVTEILNQHLPNVKYKLNEEQLGKNIVENEIEEWKIECRRFKEYTHKVSKYFTFSQVA
jgi:hypothetical protein